MGGRWSETVRAYHSPPGTSEALSEEERHLKLTGEFDCDPSPLALLRHASSFFFSSRRRHTRFDCDWSSDVCSSDLIGVVLRKLTHLRERKTTTFIDIERDRRLRPDDQGGATLQRAALHRKKIRDNEIGRAHV